MALRWAMSFSNDNSEEQNHSAQVIPLESKKLERIEANNDDLETVVGIFEMLLKWDRELPEKSGGTS